MIGSCGVRGQCKTIHFWGAPNIGAPIDWSLRVEPTVPKPKFIQVDDDDDEPEVKPRRKRIRACAGPPRAWQGKMTGCIHIHPGGTLVTDSDHPKRFVCKWCGARMLPELPA